MQLRQLHDLAMKYKINKQVIQEFEAWFGLDETINIIKLGKQDLKKTIRVNLLKNDHQSIKDKLRYDGIEIKSIREIEEAFEVLKGQNKIGFSQSYLQGEIMSQGYGSMASIQALDPKPGEYILDMAAAPGGKSSFIGERMKNKGLLIANDRSKKRLSSLLGNLSRHNIRNVKITMHDGVKFPHDQFDRILLDAPCSGDGLIVSNNDRRLRKGVNAYEMKKQQIMMLGKTIELLKPDGTGVYATCAMTPVENEEVLGTFLDLIKIEQISIKGDPGFGDIDPQLKNARRLLPSKFSCDGFFIAKFRRIDK